MAKIRRCSPEVTDSLSNHDDQLNAKLLFSTSNLQCDWRITWLLLILSVEKCHSYAYNSLSKRFFFTALFLLSFSENRRADRAGKIETGVLTGEHKLCQTYGLGVHSYLYRGLCGELQSASRGKKVLCAGYIGYRRKWREMLSPMAERSSENLSQSRKKNDQINNQSNFEANACNRRPARENYCNWI